MVVDYSMGDLISAEYEHDCCHSVLSEMEIGDDEVSWRVNIKNLRYFTRPDRSSTPVSTIGPLLFGS